MGEFFRGWRRKAGCVTLVMALVLMLAWVRSLSRVDTIEFISAFGKRHSISSVSGRVNWIRWEWYSPLPTKMAWTSAPNESRFSNLWLSKENSTIANKDDLLAMGEGIFLPYWFFIAPLTLLSAWLLLSKPRNASPRKITEPIPTEGA